MTLLQQIMRCFKKKANRKIELYHPSLSHLTIVLKKHSRSVTFNLCVSWEWNILLMIIINECLNWTDLSHEMFASFLNPRPHLNIPFKNDEIGDLRVCVCGRVSILFYSANECKTFNVTLVSHPTRKTTISPRAHTCTSDVTCIQVV